MQAHYAFTFEREMGCTEDELRGWLPRASGERPIQWCERGVAMALDNGRVSITWRVGQMRRIALIALPRLHVRFEACGVDEAAWQAFMRHFDLATQRGGG